MKPLQEPAAHVAAGLQGVGCLCGATGNKVVVVAQNGHPSAGGLHDVAHWGCGQGVMAAAHSCIDTIIVCAVQPDNSAEDCNGSCATQEQGVKS